MDFKDWSLNDLFKARDALVVLRDLGFNVEPELTEVSDGIQVHPDNPDQERC